MKIILIGPTVPFRGGISHHTTLLYRHLKARHQVEFFAFARQYPIWLFPGKTDIDPSKVHIEEAGAQKIINPWNPFCWVVVVKKIMISRPQVLIIPWWVSFWAPCFWAISFLVKIFGNTRILFLCHNVIEHEANVIDKILTGIVLRNGDGFIVQSENDKENLLKIFPRGRVLKTFHPTYDVFDMNHINDCDVRKRLRISGNVILFFGFVRPYKGLRYLILALPEVLAKVKVTLLVVGEFWKDKEEYLSLIQSLHLENRVMLVDEYIRNEDVKGVFSAADLVVQPYVSATGSGVIQTSFAFNKPVIATKVGSLPEIIVDGKTGYIVPPKSPKDLAEAIIRFFHERKGKIFSENIDKAKYKFSWDKIIDCIEELAGFDSEILGFGS
jgi:glycosyltransferase involved in cell wall biosynthesis